MTERLSSPSAAEGTRKVRSMRIYEALREEILRGDLAPGSRLITREIGTKYGASDIPVREALWVLNREGLVEMNAYSGARVAKLTRKEVLEVLVVRANLEGLATELATELIDADGIAELHALAERMQAVVDSARPDPMEYAALNRTFHNTIFQHCGNGRLVHAIQLMWEGHSQLQAVFRLNPDRLRHSLSEHRAILAALEAGDGQRAGELASEHKKLQQQDLLTVMGEEEEEIE